MIKFKRRFKRSSLDERSALYGLFQLIRVPVATKTCHMLQLPGAGGCTDVWQKSGVSQSRDENFIFVNPVHCSHPD